MLAARCARTRRLPPRDRSVLEPRIPVPARSSGQGLATAVSRDAIAAATNIDAELPIVAYLLEHNTASEVVARKLGLELVHRAPDAGNPDPAAVRLVFADRELTPAQLDATLN